jgi:hypothetical protein
MGCSGTIKITSGGKDITSDWVKRDQDALAHLTGLVAKAEGSVSGAPRSRFEFATRAASVQLCMS